MSIMDVEVDKIREICKVHPLLGRHIRTVQP